MNGMNFEVVQATKRWLLAGEAIWFVTILETWGASPRPKGSVLAFNAMKNKVVGSLSGGCVEEDLLIQLRDKGEASRPFKLRFGESTEEQARYELPCGGIIEIVVEYLLPEQATLDHFYFIANALEARECIRRKLNLNSGEYSLVDASPSTPAFILEEEVLHHVFGPPYRLLIVGAGEIARYLIPMAESLDFAVTLCDPRQDVIDRIECDFGSVELRVALPDDLVRGRFNDQHCAIVALSHDPRVDDLAIIEAVQSQAFYVGAMGSVRTSENRRLRLSTLGVDDRALGRLHAPIGLDIYSKTPSEIAVSIAAQLVKERKSNQEIVKDC